MHWIVHLSKDAAKHLSRLPREQQTPIRECLRGMYDDPFQANTIPLKGRQWHGWYRKRVGQYRIIFVPHHDTHVVEISAILLRDEKTYR